VLYILPAKDLIEQYNTHMIIVFGLPGTGKTYIGTILKESFDFFLYDADSDLPDDMKHNLLNSLPITNSMRDSFMKKVIDHIEILNKKHNNLVIAQTFLKESYRSHILQRFPNTQFILIQTEKDVREKRLEERKQFVLDKKYAQKMSENFEYPHIPHYTINNTLDGTEAIKNQIQDLLKKFSLNKKIHN